MQAFWVPSPALTGKHRFCADNNCMETTEQLPVTLMTIEDLAVYLAKPVKTLYSWRARAEPYGPPAMRLGRELRYRREDVELWLAAQMIPMAG